jgi:predicted YcjX-like family ATPase
MRPRVVLVGLGGRYTMQLQIGRLLSKAGSTFYRVAHSSSIDLAVTGLSRAGKTVFVTSLVQNLRRTDPSIYRDGGSLEAFLPFKSGALRNVALPPSGHRIRPRFPFEECLGALASENPSWPKRTGAVSEIEVRLQFGRPRSRLNGEEKAVANVTLRIVDYPGEWLLDLPLLNQGFDQWSAATIALSREKSRAALSERWRFFLGTRAASEADEDAFCRQAAEHYRDYLVECRRKGLRFLQPGQFLRQEGQDDEDARPILDRPQLWFCPLPTPAGGKWKAGSIGAKMAERYDAYCSETVGKFLKETFGRFGRQLVLVDVLSSLNGGSEVFDDTCRALSEVCRYLRSNSEKRWRFPGSIKIDKISFAATKADHVPRLQREVLSCLLGQMLRDEASENRWKEIELQTTYLSSVCSTEEERVELGGRMHDAVVGRRIDTGKRAKVIVDQIPGEMPDPAYWRQREVNGVAAFDFPTFSPPTINPNSHAGIPHIGMERLLNFLIADRFA